MRRRSGTRRHGLMGGVAAVAFKLGCLAAVCATALTFVVGFLRVPDAAMSPSLKEGDLLAFDRLARDYAVGDVVVVGPAAASDGMAHAARVVAVAGDDVATSEDGRLAVNGQEAADAEGAPALAGIGLPLTVPAGCVLVAQDGAATGEDAAVCGCVAEDAVEGVACGLFRRRSF